MKIKSIKSITNLKSKTVLVRCDFDVPLKNKKVADDSRLVAAVPTIKYLLQKGARVVLMGHLGRPGGKFVKEMSLVPVKNRLEKLLNKKISFSNNTEGILRYAQNDKGVLMMLENLRFWPGEEKNDKKFAKKLASLGDFYVNEAFAVSHRSAASVDAIKDFLPSYAGLNLEQEILHLSAVLNKPQKPMVAIIGGAKIETKLPVIKQFMKTADYVLVGGGVANDFLKVGGIDVKKSLVDEKYLGEAKRIIKTLKHKSIKAKVLIPIDWKEKNDKILDIGPKTIKLYSEIIKKAKTIVWNGPMGYFEDKKFAVGTNEVAKAILNSKASSVIGGGETGEAIQKSKIKNKKSKLNNKFISTGGGAMLEYLSGKNLPGLNKIIK